MLLIVCADWSCAQVKKQGGGRPGPLVPTALELIRESCECGGYPGSRYTIIYGAQMRPENTGCAYDIVPVLRASDSLKISILSRLLSVADTGLSCRPVTRYGSTVVPPPVAKRYSLQIDALFTFNFIAFGVDARNYSPYPVLYDTVTGLEVGNDHQKIGEVMGIYRTWLQEASQNGFKGYSFPLLGTRYKWYGGMTERRFYDKLPVHPKVDNLGVPYLD